MTMSRLAKTRQARIEQLFNTALKRADRIVERHVKGVIVQAHRRWPNHTVKFVSGMGTYYFVIVPKRTKMAYTEFVVSSNDLYGRMHGGGFFALHENLFRITEDLIKCLEWLDGVTDREWRVWP